MIGLLSLLLVDLLQLIIPLVIKEAIDLLTRGAAVPALLLRQGLIIVGIAVGIGAFRYVWRYLLFGHSRKVERKLRNRLYAHLQTLPPSFYQKSKTGDLMARAINDINAIRMATGMGLVAMTDGTVLGLSAIGFMLSISPKLTAVSLIPAPVIVLLTRVLTKRMSTGFERVQKSFADVSERVREAFAGVRVVKAYNREQWERERVETEGERYVSHNLSLAKTLAFFFPMMVVFTNMGLAIVLWMGGRFAILGQITTGDFVAFISYLNLLTWPMMAMGWVTNLFQSGSASMRRINGILDEPSEIRGLSDGFSVSRMRGEIEIRGLSFQYPGKNTLQLEDINLNITAGETVALVGRVGSGKTSLLESLVRLIEAPPGTVLVDGQDIHRLPLEFLRKNIGFVTQEVFLFSETIRENILMGRKGISDGDLRKILEISVVREEVESLEEGVDSILGERGMTLSGGQRQRLTVARALLSDPAVLILDDAFSMVDTRTEELMLDRLLAFRKQKTNLIVSHRASTLARVERVVVLDNGRVVDQGEHPALLKKGGLYARLYEERRLEEELMTS